MRSWNSIRYHRIDMLRMLGLVLLYILLINIIFSYIYTHGEASVIWLPSGVGVGILLLYGKRYWPAIFMGVLLSYVIVLNRPLLHSASVALLSNTFEALATVWLLSKIKFQGKLFDPALREPEDLIILSASAVISSCAAALLGCVLLNLLSVYEPQNFLVDILHWWMGNLLGILLITPLILTWRRMHQYWESNYRLKLEMAAYLILAFLCGQILFMGWMNSFFGDISGSYWMFVFVCWGALRFGLHGTLLVITMFAIQLVIGYQHGLGIFGDDSFSANLVNSWFYLITLSLLGIVLSSVIEKRRETEAQLAASESRWKFALEAAGDGVWDWNLQTNEVVFSKNWKAMLGYAEQDVANSLAEWEERVHEDDKEKVLSDLNAYLSGKSSGYINEHRMRCKDGSWKWILARGLVFGQTAEGKPTRMIGTHTDITRHKSLENALKQNEEDLYTIFSESPDGIVVFDDARSILHVNEVFCKITGFRSDELIGIKEAEFDIKMQSLCGNSSNYPTTTNIAHPPAASFSLKEKPLPKRRATDKAQQIEFLTPVHRILLRTMTELDQKRLSRVMHFRDSTADILVDRMKSEFLSTAAHELRTPMSIILGYAELLKLKSFDESTQLRMVDSIHNQSQSIVSLLNELLDLARIEAGSGKSFNMEMVALAPMIEDLTDSFIMAGDTRKVKLVPIPTLPDVMIDKEKISQALKNCLSNAFKFSAKDTEVSMQVSITDANNQPEISISIIDHGIGMTTEQIKRVFEKFYRADTSGKIPGTGLGMSIIKEIIEQHGGEVRVASDYGTGTTITLTLPVVHNKD